MTLDTFFKKFDQFADAPNAVAKMRQLVLDLAVKGRLTERDPTKESVASKYSREPSSEELPANWRLLNFGKYCDIQGGNQPPKSQFSDKPKPGYIRMFQIRDLGKKPVPTYISKESTNRFCFDGEILIGRYGASVGKIFWAQNGAYNVALAKFIFPEDALLPSFAFRVLKSDFFQDEIAGASRSAQAGFNKGDLASIDFPLPPLAEQKRIVAKVDELMALCDRLEAQQQERDEQASALARASLARFAEAPTPANLNLLFHRSYNISPPDLRKSILTLAVQGKLVKQNPKEGKTKLVTMEELVGRKNLKNGLSLSPTVDPTDFVCLPLSAVNGSNLDCSYGKPIAISAERAAPYLIVPGDIFIMRGNGSKERVGIAAMARTAPTNVLFPDLLIRIPIPPAKIDGEYFLIAWNNPTTRKTVEALAATTAGIWKINQGHISECSISLPPLAEQRRIVAKVDQLMALLDQLETQLAASRVTAKKLLEAVVAELTQSP